MRRRRPELKVVKQETGNGCVHHWVLGEPVGGIILGGCRVCGASRSFPSSLETAERFDDYRELTASSTYYDRSRQSA